jgi:glutaminyl-peptide cyclotransferase
MPNAMWLFIFVLSQLLTSSLGYIALSDASLQGIPSGGSDFDIDHGLLLAPLLIPRVPGTLGQEKAQDHLVSFFTTQLPAWTLTWQNSTSTTPKTGSRQVPFANIILRRDPPWAAEGDVARLTLVAHYDSRYEPAGFVGATDSAAPCAILMHVARVVDAALSRKWAGMLARGETSDGLEEEKGLQIVFMDGEEAWDQWTATDSLYGSRYVFCCLPMTSSSSSSSSSFFLLFLFSSHFFF